MVLDNAFAIFIRDGVADLSAEQLARKLDLSPDLFRELFTSPENLLLESVRHNLAEDKRELTQELAAATNPAEELMILVATGIRKSNRYHTIFFEELQQHHPEVWSLYQKYIHDDTFHLVYDILNRGVVQGAFRKDINLALVTKILFEQLNMLLNPRTFPPERYALEEVFRSIFLYYVRGLCTEQGMRLSETFFTKSVF